MFAFGAGDLVAEWQLAGGNEVQAVGAAERVLVGSLDGLPSAVARFKGQQTQVIAGPSEDLDDSARADFRAVFVAGEDEVVLLDLVHPFGATDFFRDRDLAGRRRLGCRGFQAFEDAEARQQHAVDDPRPQQP